MDNLHIGLQVGLRTNLHAFEWLAKHPKVFNDFNVFMSAQREGRAYWLDFYPFEQKLSAEARDNKQDVLFVDVGGALGSEIKELRKRYPSVKGRMILQDQQQTIDHVSVDPGMEAMVHDFFTPQPVIGMSSRNLPLNHSEQPHFPHTSFLSNARKISSCYLAPSSPIKDRLTPSSLTGARFYYLRNILHDWPDPPARLILQNISLAMTPGMSRLLINEVVVSLQNSGNFPTHSDFNMMSLLAGMERTKIQWEQLLASVGLEIKKIWDRRGGDREHH